MFHQNKMPKWFVAMDGHRWAECAACGRCFKIKQRSGNPSTSCSDKCWRVITYRRNHGYYRTNQQEMLRRRIRTRIRKLLNGQKSESTRNILGCDLLTFRKHIESKFERGMSWVNFGEWHIDHEQPCAAFDLRDPEQLKQCFHYSNLRPLWKQENHAKGAKIVVCQPEFPMNITHSFATTAIGVTPRRAA